MHVRLCTFCSVIDSIYNGTHGLIINTSYLMGPNVGSSHSPKTKVPMEQLLPSAAEAYTISPHSVYKSQIRGG